MNEYNLMYSKHVNTLKNKKIPENSLVLYFTNFNNNLNILFPNELIESVDLILFDLYIKNKKYPFYFVKNESNQFVCFSRIRTIRDGQVVYNENFKGHQLYKIKKIEEFIQSLVNRSVIC